ncbi:16838_t:CDS:2 [Funneliformis mosseae]|uniref:16838_t:CDS:1 n=1 Tax=Funneliformis mosseae TaxID=27381 RepID=A0A9N9GJ05_FUNMO|nr:16838_t:CDS:2 [Funneliformis mosseae]
MYISLTPGHTPLMGYMMEGVMLYNGKQRFQPIIPNRIPLSSRRTGINS